MMPKAAVDKGFRQLDPATVSVLANRFDSICREMMNTILRSGRSGVLNMARDFSCAIVTSNNDLLASAESLPAHVAGMEFQTEAMTSMHPDLSKGDAYLHNSPYHGNTHHADHTILVPVFDGQGRHRFTACAKAHQADIGNAMPTTYMANARDIYEEGALNFPCVRIQRNHEDMDDIIRMCRMRIRIPDQWYGDYLATLNAARVAERRMEALGEEYDWDLLEVFAQEWFDYSERYMVDVISELPGGRWEGVSCHDPFPGVPDGVPVKVKVEVDPKVGQITVDLRENIDCVPSGLNQSRATATANSMIGVFNSIDPDIPHNAGSFRRVSVLLRENCVVGIPIHPTCCSAATTNVADRIINSVQATFASMRDGLGMAEGGVAMPPAWGVISGWDERDESSPKEFVNQIFFAVTGGAASPTADGWLNQGHPANAGLLYRDSVEIDELRFPLRVYEQRIRPDSEGAGRFRGAPGAYVEYGPSKGEVTIIYLSDGHQNPARGVRGGLSGGSARVQKRNADGTLEVLPQCAAVTLTAGERIVSESCGGGGYGPPLERDAHAVLHDFLEGWISADRARDVYGVAFETAPSAELIVDEAGTRRLRQKGRPLPDRSSAGQT